MKYILIVGKKRPEFVDDNIFEMSEFTLPEGMCVFEKWTLSTAVETLEQYGHPEVVITRAIYPAKSGGEDDVGSGKVFIETISDMGYVGHVVYYADDSTYIGQVRAIQVGGRPVQVFLQHQTNAFVVAKYCRSLLGG